MNEALLKQEEKAVYALRALFRRYGYQPFRMSRFEEYDLYVRNKDFLVSDSVITFTDTNGRLMALKPDVTLSIIKNTVDEPGCKQKLSYNENVYRVSARTGQYKELMQTGVECIGDIDGYDIYEVVSLAAASLAAISPAYMLDLSHMGIYAALLDDFSVPDGLRRAFAPLVAARNRHEAESLCRDCGLSDAATEALCALCEMYGSPETVLPRLSPLCQSEAARRAYTELCALCTLLAASPYADRIRIDFSVSGDMRYYNGILFRGYLDGIAESVLAGGEYGRLVRRMGKKSNAIGFALYLDLLEDLDTARTETDVDVLLLYSEKTDPARIITRRDALIEKGKSVSAQKAIPQKLRYGACIDLDREEN